MTQHYSQNGNDFNKQNRLNSKYLHVLINTSKKLGINTGTKTLEFDTATKVNKIKKFSVYTLYT